MPEALEQGLKKAAALQWSAPQHDAAKVAFLLADAPPHPENLGEALNQAQALRKQGVRLHSIAASGKTQETELFMRVASLISLGRYLFLTNDSGVGAPHEEPKDGPYAVQKLSVLVRQIIESELKGEKVIPAKEDILREVGAGR